MDELYAATANALRSGERVALATIIQAEGSTPRGLGTQMLICESGRTLGTIGGGSLEARVLQDACAALASGHSQLRHYSLHAAEGESLGICGGAIQVFIHVLLPADRLVIIGAGHVARPLAQLAAAVGFDVLVVDDRPEYLTPERFAQVRTQLVSFSHLPAQLPLDGRTFAVIATRSHEHDEEVLRQLVQQPLAYLGLMGSRAKVRLLFQRLVAEGCSPEQLARVCAPIGLDIGAETPEEIAISIVAELVRTRRGGTGRPLSQLARCAPSPTSEPSEQADG
ncbi:MAG: XdhC/CoxI family protein [Anaerolineae bacterium]|nr:XdhC/CoxI family protein [Anaerolineae bacterium]